MPLAATLQLQVQGRISNRVQMLVTGHSQPADSGRIARGPPSSTSTSLDVYLDESIWDDKHSWRAV